MKGMCRWFLRETGPLADYLADKGNYYDFYCNDNEQTIIVQYLQCVKLNKIENREAWNPGRLVNIRKWATDEKLRIAFLQKNENGQLIFTNHHNLHVGHQIPVLSREGSYPEIMDKEFQITDGVQRIAHAKEIGLDCIMADVEEAVTVDRYKDKHLYRGFDEQ